MNASFRKSFIKDYDRLSQKVRQATEKRLVKFRKDPYLAELNNHSLLGRWYGCRSINISGDIRAVYEEVSEDEAVFVAIGTHSQLYR